MRKPFHHIVSLMVFCLMAMPFYEVTGQIQDRGQQGRQGRQQPGRQQQEQETQQQEEQQREEEDTIQYGPSTTRYLYEEDIHLNQENYSHVDTLLDGVPDFSMVDQNNRMLQYLGTMGTALRPVYPQLPEVIGNKPGFSAYDRYFIRPRDVKYYDTQSPFTKIDYAIGGNGRSFVDVEFSRNINPVWNLGANVKRWSIDKQLGPSTTRGDKQVMSTAYNFYTRYRTRNLKYQVLANFSRSHHEVQESGGIDLQGGAEFEDFFGYEDANVVLENATSRQLKVNYHLYHQYRFNDQLQLYHIIDRQHQINQFEYFGLPHDSAYFDNTYFRPDSTFDSSTFTYLQNEGGIKGDLAKLYYNVYYKLRNPQIRGRLPNYIYNNKTIKLPWEHYLGADFIWNFQKNTLIRFKGEYLPFNHYNLQAQIKTGFFEGGYQRTREKPSLKANYYSGNHSRWFNDFNAINSDQIKGGITLKNEQINFNPFVTLTNVNQGIYYRPKNILDGDTITFGNQAQPFQAFGAAQIISPGINLDFALFDSLLRIENTLIYSKVTGNAADNYRIPEIFANSSLFMQKTYLDGKIQARMGLKFHYKSSYYGHGYDPVIQQYYVQDEFRLPRNFLVDYFFTLKVSQTRLFVKVPQLNQGLIADGYFSTPYYTGQKRVIDLGIHWMFFD